MKFKNLFVIPFAFLIVLIGTITVVAQQQSQDTPRIVKRFDTSDFSQVNKFVNEAIAKHSAASTLLVVDIDNTLLAMNQDLGSDQWFNWQSDLLSNNPESADLVASDFAGLLSVQGTVFALSGMHPPEPELPRLLRSIQDAGVTTVVLTSRGPEFRNAAERELKNNDYDLARADTVLKIDEVRRGLFKPYVVSKPEHHGLSAEVMAQLGPPRDVSYANGIYMTAGQHKGYMLKTLLARSNRSFKTIVFVDDHGKHTDRMHDSFANDTLDLATFRYGQEDGNVSNFNKSSKKHVVHDWNRLKAYIDQVLVK